MAAISMDLGTENLAKLASCVNSRLDTIIKMGNVNEREVLWILEERNLLAEFLQRLLTYNNRMIAYKDVSIKIKMRQRELDFTYLHAKETGNIDVMILLQTKYSLWNFTSGQLQ